MTLFSFNCLFTQEKTRQTWKMSESKNHFVFELLVLLCCISFQNVSGIQIKLTRDEKGDYFDNPYATSADDDDETFCLSRNAKCRTKRDQKCLSCKCQGMKTFDEKSMLCASKQKFDRGCRTWLSRNSIKRLDLTQNKKTKLRTFSDEDVKSVSIISMNGRRVHFFTQTTKEPAHDEDHWEIEIKWENVPKETYDGQVFRVQISYEIDDDDSSSHRNDCFVFKSKGIINVTFPDLTTATPLSSTSEKSIIESLPSHTVPPTTGTIPTLATTPPLPLTSEKSTVQTSPSHMVSHSAVTIPTLTTAAPSPSAIEKSTAQISPSLTVPSTTTTTASPTKIRIKNTDPFNSTNEARKKESSDGENNAVAVSLAVVGCLLLLAVILAVLWFRRRSKRTSEDKSREISLKNGNVENPMTMSQPKSIYAEAESSITSPDKDEDNHDYDYADGNLKNYASLEMTKVERKPVYQSLINAERDLNKHIPNESRETSTAEPFYHVVEGEDGNQDPGQIYHVLEDPEKTYNCGTQDAPGRTGHENPVYSTLEEENAPETCSREVSEGTGDDNP